MRRFCSVLGVCLFLGLCSAAQDLSDKKQYDELRAHALELFKGNNFLAALPELQKLADENPKDAGVLEALGFALASRALLETDNDARRSERIAARKYLIAAKQLGDHSEMLTYLLETTPEDGTPRKFSDNNEINKLMQSAETHFARGELEEAKAGYLQVLLLDSDNYLATLFTGDVYFKQQQFGSACQWFQKAIEVQPDVETAYRYWGDALDRMGRPEEARRKFIEAIVAEPYNSSSSQHLAAWMKVRGLPLAIPRIQSPNSVTVDGAQKININIDPSSIGKQDGSDAWMLYSINRAAWQKDLFKKNFPNEQQYRHSLKEEHDSLALVVSSVKGNNDIKALNPQIALLVKISDAGMLDPYILLNSADQGIAQDYVAYRKEHRELLYKYLDTIVVPQLKPAL
jgi:Flp pilus assembly protein TadD